MLHEVEGFWAVPLRGGIDVVDRADKQHMEESAVYARVEEPGVLNGYDKPEIEVSWLGTDDETRRTTVDLAGVTFTPYE